MGRSITKRFGLVLAVVALAFWFTGMETAYAVRLSPQLSDPAAQPKFVEMVPNALDPGFKYVEDSPGVFTVGVGPAMTLTGLLDNGGNPVPTPIFGYGQGGVYTWPGKTFEITATTGETQVNWLNNLGGVTEHLLPVDKSLHWAYSLPGYKQYTIEENGIPIIVHLHGGHTDFQFDGNPEFFFTPGAAIVGPQWADVPGGFTNEFMYDNTVPAGNLWYHDHVLGITRLNVYAGMAGFYFKRDADDTGTAGNSLTLPAWPYEMALAIQDRMFKKGGKLFYPALPPDPFWDDFITGEGLKNKDVPKPSALAEMFGDHMVVNGKIWPKANVEPRNYRLRLLNGCDSRFLVIQFKEVDLGVTDPTEGTAKSFYVIGSDQGLGRQAELMDKLVIEPGGRYDVIFDFDLVGGNAVPDKRIIMENIGYDAPFGGDFGNPPPEEDVFPDRQTDRIMAFDVTETFNGAVADNFNPANIAANTPWNGNTNTVDNTRKVALFEGKDEFGRLQPLLGVVNADNTATAYTWFQPTTENPDLNDTEIWEIYNFTGDAHPIHLHLVNFEILDRHEITFDADEENPDQVLQHNGLFGTVAAISNILVGDAANLGPGDGYYEDAPKDMVTALPEQRVRVQATFDKPGRYVWHCHILSHEDHEMMRVLQVEEP